MEKWFEYHTIPPSQSLHVRCLVPGHVEPRTSQADRAMAYFCWVVRTATIGPAVWCSSANIKGAVSRDFRTLFFFINQTHLGP